MRALRAAGCVVLGLVSLAALGLLFPFIKEGYNRDELALFGSIAAGLASLAGAWWLLNRRHRAFAVAGLALLALPTAAYGFLSVRVVVNEWRGRRLARTVRVLSVREEAIRWPGLSHAIGVRLDVELEQAIGLEGNLFPPKLVMGADPRFTPSEYFFGPLDHGVDAFLGAPLFEPDRPQPARDVFLRPGRTRLVYELFPSTLEKRDGGALCLNSTASRADYRGLASTPGTHLGAAWFFAAPGGLYVDLGPPLTDALRRASAYEGEAEAWAGLMRALDPATLVAAGYAPCAADRHQAQTCYCAQVP